MEKFILIGGMAGLSLLAGCVAGIVSDGPSRAEAVLSPTSGNTVAGRAVFSQAGKKLRLLVEVSGLTPGLHGFHIHEKGDCSAPDGSSAGGHFNPFAKPHGNPEHAEHHAGDMPQLVADAKGVAKLTAYLDGLRIGEGEGNILGRGLIVHAAGDDFKTQPTGNSGARQACGVIVQK